MLGGVPWRVQNLHAHLAHIDLVPVSKRTMVVTQVRLRGAQQLDVGAFGELGQSREIVVVAMGVEGVANAQALHAGSLEVAADVAVRVEHERLARVLRPDQVGGVAQPLEVELPKEHRRLKLSARRAGRLTPAPRPSWPETPRPPPLSGPR